MATRLFEFSDDAPTRLGLVHGDAHPGNFMLMPGDKMGVIDFGAVAPMPGGWPIELGQILRYAVDKNYDKLLPTMEKIGFIQKGEQVSTRQIDDMLQQYVEPLEVPVFHYTRKWLQRMTALNMERAPGQIKAARQMDIPAKLAIPMRVIASVVAISCQLDAHVPTRRIADEMVPGFANPDAVAGPVGALSARPSPPRPRSTGRSGSSCDGVLAGPTTRALARDDAAAFDDLAAPHTPRLLPIERRGQALPADRAVRAQHLGAFEVGRDSRRTTDRAHRHGTAAPAASARPTSADCQA